MSPDELSLEQRIDRIESRTAIADLVHGYARAVRHGNADAAAALFVADGWFEICEGLPGPEPRCRARLEGREAYRDYLKLAGQKAPPSSPMIHNLIIHFAGPDAAQGNAVLDVLTLTTGHRITGEYHDTFRRENGRWLFVSRRFVIQAGG